MNNTDQQPCFHCGLPVPPNLDLHVHIQGEDRAMCCAGCQAVAQAIMDNGLEDFYKHRTENAPTGQELVPEFLRQTEIYDNPEIQKNFVQHDGEHVREASLILEGITCAACVWLNERHLRSLPGVLQVYVNYSTHRASVRWDNRQIQLSQILQAISAIGYMAHPYDPSRQQELLEAERKRQLKRIGLAGVLGMQVMMISVGLYAGDFYGMEAYYRDFFHWINLILTIPVMLYSAQPFFKSAWRDLSLRQAGMDVPVSLGISLAFFGSVWTTLFGGEHVYYDSVIMFVFFLSLGRYFELMARKRSAHAAESLVQMVPAMATRINADGEEDIIAVAELNPDDIVRVKPGDSVPADGVIISGQSSVDESLLTGESLPLPKQADDKLTAGTVNIESPLTMRVEKIGQDTLLSHILRLLERAQTEKPAITQLADKAAAWFVLAVLVLATAVASYWWQVSPEYWLAITLSVLVVTCPCALSLATPTAVTAATGNLTQHGLLTTRGHALETLAKASHFVFDKTGTLTDGKLHVLDTQVFSALSREQCLAYAAALEQQSEHPLGKALVTAAATASILRQAQDSVLRQQAQDSVLRQAQDTASSGNGDALTGAANEVNNFPGQGLSGTIDGQNWYIGTHAFIQTQTGLQADAQRLKNLQAEGRSLVWLADSQQIHCAFALGDQVRDGAAELVSKLQQAGKQVLLLTGDHQASAQRVAQSVGITDVYANLSPDDKLKQVKALQAQGTVVAMIGDGVNDAPVLAAAQVSIAMGGGTQVARASADMILLSEHLPNLLHGIDTSRKTLHIIRQNLTWAVSYNLLALPAAAMGFVLPWMAAIGMSASSLLVVANALRLTAQPSKEQP